jgi:ABC-type uncharacterized transport system involved in gliding motility auxiliary subunit
MNIGSQKIGKGKLLVIGALFVGVMALANVLLRGAQIDLTQDRLYTISDGTMNLVHSLPEPVNLYFFFSDAEVAARPEFRNYGVRVREFLEELTSRSKGKLTLKVIDPEPYSEEEDRATELGVTSVPLDATGAKLYLGLAATNSTDGHQALPFLDIRQEEMLEYDVAKLIYQLGTAKKPVVGWLSSIAMNGDFDPQTGQQSPPWYVLAQSQQLFDVRMLEPTLTSVGDEVDVLVLVHPKNLPPAALYAIDQFALRGGRVLLFVDPDSMMDRAGQDPSNPMAQFGASRSSSLDPLLANWGVDYNSSEVVADLDRAMLVDMGPGNPPAQHIAIIAIDSEGLTKDVTTAGLTQLRMITAGSLAAKAGAKTKFEPLMLTGKNAGVLPTQRLSLMSDPATLRDGFRPTGKQYALAARVTGDVTSAFPNGPPEGVAPVANPLKTSAKPLNLIVVADSDMLMDRAWVEVRNFFGQQVAQPSANNGDLVWNALDNLGGSADLISIRGRAAFSRPFKRVDELRREADTRFRATELRLEEELQQTEANLTKLQTSRPGDDAAVITPEQAAEIERFQTEKLRIRKELRAVKAGLASDIEALGTRIKVLNIVVAPLVFLALLMLAAEWSRRRRHAIVMLRKQEKSPREQPNREQQ